MVGAVAIGAHGCLFPSGTGQAQRGRFPRANQTCDGAKPKRDRVCRKFGTL